MIRLGERLIGKGHRVFVVAEVGINHNGDLALARKSIDAAVASGADAVKFQNYRTEDFITDRSLTYEYTSQGKRVSEPQYDLFKRYELDKGSFLELKAYCDQQQIIFHSTPTSISGIQDLLDLGVLVLKNGSDYLTHLALISAMGKTGLPTVISTGMSTLAEIDEAVRTFRETGNDRLLLLHCTSSYPTPSHAVNLSRIPPLAEIFGCPVGFSDHTEGIAAAVGATALGACWIEKHFTVDKDLPGPDHRFSADPAEFRALVQAVRCVERCLGSPEIQPTSGEMQGRQDFRLSCVAGCALRAGHILTEEDIAFCRPGTGLPPNLSSILVGRRLKRPLEAGAAVTMENLE